MMRGALGFLARHEYTPWAAVNAVRTMEPQLGNPSCDECDCTERVLASCAFLLECAAVEATREHDWLTRNEAVIQLCWVLGHIHTSRDVVTLDMRNWCSVHSRHMRVSRLQPRERDTNNVPCSVMLYAIDHAPHDVDGEQSVRGEIRSDGDQRGPCTEEDRNKNHGTPDYVRALTPELTVTASKRFELNPGRVTDNNYENICCAASAVGTSQSAVNEALPDDPDRVALCIALNYPRVAESAVDQLGFDLPARDTYRGIYWPEYVNATRACYPLYKTLALPPAPNPAYVVDLLVHAWRLIGPDTVRVFFPTASGSTHRVDPERYRAHFVAPLNVLQTRGVITAQEHSCVLRTLRAGVLPCFAGAGESCPDKVTNYTLAIAFAGCGIRLGRYVACSDDVTVTHAGVMYFVVWYILVYVCNVHTRPGLRDTLLESGSAADKLVCEMFTVDSRDGATVNFNGARLRLLLHVLFDGLLSERERLHVAKLYIPAVCAQLRYAVTDRASPGCVRDALDVKREHYVKAYNVEDDDAKRRLYLGALAANVHSTIRGTLHSPSDKRVAAAVDSALGIEFDVWCDTLLEPPSSPHTPDLLELLANDLESSPVCREHNRDDSIHATPARGTTIDSPTHFTSDPDSASPRAGSENAELLVRLCEGLSILSASHSKRVSKIEIVNETHPPEYMPGDRNVLHRASPITIDVFPRFQRVVHHARFNLDSVVVFTHTKLVVALWNVLHVAQPSREPTTPERLAVMIHLFAMYIDTADSEFAKCTNITVVYGECSEPEEYIPIVVTACELFNVNILIRDHDTTYIICDKRSDSNSVNANAWLVLGTNSWSVTRASNSETETSRGTDISRCTDASTLAAYLSLNGLTEVHVAKDHYCGFHAVEVLLDISSDSLYHLRCLIVTRVLDYLDQFSLENEDLLAYLRELEYEPEMLSSQALREYMHTELMKENRWLTVSDMSFIFQAYGREVVFILESVFPVYDERALYVYIANDHYTPIVKIS